MKPLVGMPSLWLGAVALGLSLVTTPVSAQFVRVADVPATEVFSVSTNGDTIAVGIDRVYLSTDAGVTWHPSAKPAAGVASIQAVVIRDGRLYSGTYGQGVFTSDDLGATWQPFNQGLVGGVLDSQLFISDLQLRGYDLFAATAGAGVYVRHLVGASTWSPSGQVWEPNQAPNVNALGLGGVRLLATAGANGSVFYQEPGDPEWTVSNLDNVGIHAGLQGMTAVFTGTAWVVGTNLGVFHSAAGQEPWTRSSLNLGPLAWSTFALQGHHLFAAFYTGVSTVFGESDDDGVTWQGLENQQNVFVKELALVGNELYAGRGDGLWRRATATASVGGGAFQALRFTLAGAQPFGDLARLRFELPEAGRASIEVFDVAGRRAGEPIDGWWPAGSHEVSLDARRLAPGVYAARLIAAGTSQVVRLVHVR